MRHRIAVVGGGPAGLTFARVLHRHHHPVTVLERDPAPDARPPGGTLDLRQAGPARAGQGGAAGGVPGAVPSRGAGHAHPGHGRDRPSRLATPSGYRANPEIDRGQLRDLLLGPLDVQWGRGVTEVVPGPPGSLVRLSSSPRLHGTAPAPPRVPSGRPPDAERSRQRCDAGRRLRPGRIRLRSRGSFSPRSSCGAALSPR
ncbi:NAD(P)-binding protein [Nonomuraea sp. NPDC049709]|uniref:FAD-dependent oxidoreductase n=1 Tax=Nonomuraea sp. NPDC049709 TaxID=3154736 RepID=UPI00343776DC